MPGTVIAFGGKGGAGKTTLSAMVIRELVRLGKRPILAVDADPNATLALTLGEEPGGTIADIRDRMGEAALEPSAIPKDRLMDQWLAEILTESVGFDVLTMGRPEGPKCYCYVNGLLRRYLKELKGSYAAIVIDCEAGMEYLSRLAVDDVDTLVLVAEANPIGLTTVRRIAELADSLPVRVSRRVLALNKVDASTPVEALVASGGAPAVDATVVVPQDAELRERCIQGRPVDDEAGGASRAAITELTQLCLEPNLART
ncbi:MAG TPA: AAA family ATPase [Planctomycetota bacterium]|nr:AAA family ATPase [Planctomycetota bacterium]